MSPGNYSQVVDPVDIDCTLAKGSLRPEFYVDILDYSVFCTAHEVNRALCRGVIL